MTQTYKSEILKLVECLYLGNIPKGFACAEIVMRKARERGDKQFVKAIEKRLDGTFLLEPGVALKNKEVHHREPIDSGRKMPQCPKCKSHDARMVEPFKLNSSKKPWRPFFCRECGERW